MKYSIDTYPLYKDEKRFAFVVRAKLRMTEPVDVDVLRAAANKAIKRYPYFAVKVEVDESGWDAEHHPLAELISEMDAIKANRED